MGLSTVPTLTLSGTKLHGLEETVADIPAAYWWGRLAVASWGVQAALGCTGPSSGLT